MMVRTRVVLAASAGVKLNAAIVVVDIPERALVTDLQPVELVARDPVALLRCGRAAPGAHDIAAEIIGRTTGADGTRSHVIRLASPLPSANECS
jgi:hypothetical protein